MSRYIEAPTEYTGDSISLFLAGGITGCPNWHGEIAALLEDLPLVILNPRRKHFPMEDPTAARQQIEWEHRHLHRASAVLFWFPCETLCPIALYELGAWSMTSKALFVGAHPEYRRRLDIEIQTQLARPDIAVVYSIEELAGKVRHWFWKESRNGKVAVSSRE